MDNLRDLTLTAYEHWHAVFGNNGYTDFWRFINAGGPDYVGYNFNPEQRRRLELLAGPYHVAIIKACKIKKDKDGSN